MVVNQYDTVLLKDGREAAIVETFENKVFIADVGDSPANWDTIDITIDDIERVLRRSERTISYEGS
jgi:hypothetical protein